MRDPKYKVFVEYTGNTERVTGIGFNVMGQVNRIHVGHTEYIIKGDRDKFRLREYTGLKDVNGVEIYEGDITSRRNWDQTVVGRVERENDGTLVLIEGKGKSYLGLFWEGVEVIGNIYEHPHLLEASE